MKKPRIIGFIIILIGILTISYPVSLRIESNIEQKKMKEEFIQKKKESELSQEKIGSSKENSQGLSHKDKKERISYDEWPKTLMTIDSIGLEAMVVEMEASDIDVFAEDVNYPPAHYRGTDFPGGESNVAIAAHRTGPADYFRKIDKLEKGDSITLETEKGVYEYKVEKVFIVDPTDNSVIKNTDYGALTLTSCEREDGISNKKRIIVRAKLKDEQIK